MVALRANFDLKKTQLPASALTHRLLTDPELVGKRIFHSQGRLEQLGLAEGTRRDIVEKTMAQTSRMLRQEESFTRLTTVQYNPNASDTELASKIWHPDMSIAGKKLSEWAPFAMPDWHFDTCGTDIFSGFATILHPWDAMVDPLARSVAKLRALYEFCGKVGIGFRCMHDGDNIDLTQPIQVVEDQFNYLAQEVTLPLQQQTGVLMGWPTNQGFAIPLYSQGFTSGPSTAAFARALEQAKHNIKFAVDTNARGFVFWGGRDGYDEIHITDFKAADEASAAFLWKCVNYGKEIGYFENGRKFWIEPKGGEPTTHQWNHDVATTWEFIIRNGLQEYFGINAEINHALLANKTPQHELEMAIARGILLGVDANTGRHCGWDRDLYPDAEAGIVIGKGLVRANGSVRIVNFDAKSQRNETDQPYDMAMGVIAGMDHIARGIFLEAINPLFAVNRARWAQLRSAEGSALLGSGTTLLQGAALARRMEQEGSLVPPPSTHEALVGRIAAFPYRGLDEAIAESFAAQQKQ